MQRRLCTERERGPQKGAVGWRWTFMPFLPSCYCPFLSCSVTRKSCSHCAHQKVFERGSLWCWRWHREIFLILCPALTSFYSCQSKGYSSCKWEKSSTEIFVKRQKIYKRLRESRVQLLQRMVKVRKQRGFCWKIHKCQSPCSALSPPLCPYQRRSVLGLTDQSPEQSPAPAQHQRKSCCLFKSLTFIFSLRATSSMFLIFWTHWSSNYRNAECLQLWVKLGGAGLRAGIVWVPWKIPHCLQ